ncbi:SDR family NAD(P)-dependent oxidoreductase [Streptomyces mirabilis]
MTVGRRMAGRVAVITGAACGIGAAPAGRLAAEGAVVVVTDVDDVADEAVAAGIADGSGRAEYVRRDLTSAAGPRLSP